MSSQRTPQQSLAVPEATSCHAFPVGLGYLAHRGKCSGGNQKKKSKFPRCSPESDNATMDFMELDNDFMKVLDDNEPHHYLATNISISISDRKLTEIQSRKQTAWMAFEKHIKALLNRNISA